MKHSDMEEASQMCDYLEDLSVIDMKEVGLKQIGDINLNIALKPEQWTRILEQVPGLWKTLRKSILILIYEQNFIRAKYVPTCKL
jgi:hypothetical protein